MAMKTKSYVVDVASYQPTNLAEYVAAGASGAIVKVSQGTYYQNPKGWGQVANAQASHMEVAGYFYATFKSNQSLAVLESQYAIASARAMGVPTGAYLATDWEEGGGNDVTGPRQANTAALIASMQTIQQAGYKPLLYSGAYVLQHNIDTAAVLRQFPNSLWVASYPTMKPVNAADMGYFPSMDGVALWQFTSNWHGKNVDASIVLLDTGNGTEKEDENMAWHPEVAYNDLGRFKVTRPSGAPLYTDYTLQKQLGLMCKVGEVYKIVAAKGGAVCAGKGQWFAQADGLTKINTLSVNPNHTGQICKIVTDDAYTQNEPAPGKGIKHLPKGSTWHVLGRKGRYLIVGNKDTGTYLDASKAKIILF